MDLQRDFIDRILPYRLVAVEVLELALRYRREWSAPVPMQVFFDGKLSIEGLSTGFINPAIETGIIHCRALLEFIGLAIDPKDHHRLTQRTSRKRDDPSIEQFSNAAGPLPLVTPAQAVAPYRGPADEAERGLAQVIHVVNKGLAHSTIGLIEDPDDFRLVDIASRGIRALLINHFYVPLGLQPPAERITARPRGSS